MCLEPSFESGKMRSTYGPMFVGSICGFHLSGLKTRLQTHHTLAKIYVVSRKYIKFISYCAHLCTSVFGSRSIIVSNEMECKIKSPENNLFYKFQHLGSNLRSVIVGEYFKIPGVP